MAQQLNKGWFSTPGRPGDRTISDQMKGLGRLLHQLDGKTILDVGCAEGMVSIALGSCGAKLVHGVEIVDDHVRVGRKMAQAEEVDNVVLETGDANTWVPPHEYDIVIMLAILHKLKNPSAACERFARAAKELVVLRMPPAPAPMVVDDRSGRVIFDIPKVLRECGFELEHDSYDGHFGEYVAYWKRVQA
jgi:ubiquinone/menaquinone biosynthesis C-methylase UbiE